MSDVSAFAELVPLDHDLCVVSALRGDGSVQSCWVKSAEWARTNGGQHRRRIGGCVKTGCRCRLDA